LSLGKRHGPVTYWQPNGKVARQSTYEDGVPVGDVMELSARNNEVSVSATYVNGRKIVTKTTNYSNRARQKQTEEMYLAATTVEQSPDEFWNVTFATYTSDGKDLLHGSAKSWYENGRPKSEGYYDYGKRSGTFTYWYPNGQAQATGEYVNDKPVGTWVWWHENGLKSAIGEYRDGFLYGPWRWWSEDGQLAKQRVYDGTEKITSETEDTIDVGQNTKETDAVVR
jgi:antitoxin component YwqK of YwqJK toxin-antitoxin module